MRSDRDSLDIAVIIVNYRTAALTVESIRSLQPERSSPGLRIGVTVVDNASGDLPALADAIAANGWSSWVTAVQAPKNGGFAYGNNLGIRHACLDSAPNYIYLLNPDAQIRPGAIKALVDFLEEQPEVGIAGSQIENTDGSEWPIAFRFPGLLSELSQGLNFGLVSRLLRPWWVARKMGAAAEPVDWVSGAAIIIRPAVLAAIGGMDENYFLYYEETDFCYRAKRAGFSTWYVPASRVVHLKGQSTGIARFHPKRLPTYWFESRRRYFARTHGIPHAMLIDIVALLACSVGYLKRKLLRQTHGVPHFTRDLLRNSVLRPRNFKFAPLRALVPTRISRGGENLRDQSR